MSWIASEWVEYQRRRFARPDAHRYVRPDAYRWQRPDQVDENAPSYLRRFRAEEMRAAESDRDAAARADAELQERRLALARLRLDWELLKFALGGRKAGFNPDQPRVPAGNPDGGQWTSEGAGAGERVRVAGPLPRNEKPEIPKTRPSGREARRIALGLARRWAGPLELLYQGAQWLRDYHAEFVSYRDPPKTMEELQRDFGKPSKPGYHDHHVNEKDAARKDGFPEELIEASENVVRIPKRKHEEITGWYMTPNRRFKNEQGEDISPRKYLYGKDWDERRRIGLEALIEFKVLKP
jgi:hypothetical protein